MGRDQTSGENLKRAAELSCDRFVDAPIEIEKGKDPDAGALNQKSNILSRQSQHLDHSTEIAFDPTYLSLETSSSNRIS